MLERETIPINIRDNGYAAEIGEGILFEDDENNTILRQNPDKVFIITDDNVKQAWGDDLRKFLSRSGLETHTLYFPAGEKSKTPETVNSLAEQLAENECSLDSLILSLGGGVVGDIAGFVASTYKRGIPYIQIPTSLVAHVDSSIGGKTGVNLKHGKNLLGSFYHPRAVISDTQTLTTLPEKEMKNGLAELIKYGIMFDRKLFEYLEETCTERRIDIYQHWIKRAVEIKSIIVEQDEKDTGIRTILNYGHTIGHAIEAESNYSIPHGEAISIGMVYEGAIAVNLGILNEKEHEKQNNLLRKANLPVNYDGDAQNLIKHMRLDKKSGRKEIRMVLPKSIGQAHQKDSFLITISEELIEESLKFKAR